MIAVYYTQLQCLCFCMWESVDHTVLSTQSLIAGEWAKQPDSIPSAKRSDEPERCSDAGFEGLPGRLQEVIRGKYVISSSSSFRPPLDQPASVWENWFSPSPPPLLSFFSSFFPLLRFHLRLVHPLSSAFPVMGSESGGDWHFSFCCASFVSDIVFIPPKPMAAFRRAHFCAHQLDFASLNNAYTQQ